MMATRSFWPSRSICAGYSPINKWRRPSTALATTRGQPDPSPVPTRPASVCTVTNSQLRLPAKALAPVADQPVWGGGPACIRWQWKSVIFIGNVVTATEAAR